MKCSRTLPCTNCVRRRIPDQCRREPVVLSKKSASEPQTNQNRTRPSSPSPTNEEQPVVISSETATPAPWSAAPAATSEGGAASAETRTRLRSPRPAGEILSMDAATALESLAWGSHRAATRIRVSPGTAGLELNTHISESHEEALLNFHRDHVAWTHNVLHMPTFIRDCKYYRRTAQVPHAAWSFLYYAVLSVCESHIQASSMTNSLSVDVVVHKKAT